MALDSVEKCFDAILIPQPCAGVSTLIYLVPFIRTVPIEVHHRVRWIRLVPGGARQPQFDWTHRRKATQRCGERTRNIGSQRRTQTSKTFFRYRFINAQRPPAALPAAWWIGWPVRQVRCCGGDPLTHSGPVVYSGQGSKKQPVPGAQPLGCPSGRGQDRP